MLTYADSDFRTLNESMEGIFAKLAGHKYVSRLELSEGYWQILLSSGSKQYTAFQMLMGLFQFTVLPFELVTAQAASNRLIREFCGRHHYLHSYMGTASVSP